MHEKIERKVYHYYILKASTCVIHTQLVMIPEFRMSLRVKFLVMATSIVLTHSLQV